MKFFKPEITIAKAAREILADQSRFITGRWAAGPFTRNSPLRGWNRFSASFRESIFESNDFKASNDPKACAWCFEGAVMKAAGDLGHNEETANNTIGLLNAVAGGSDAKPRYKSLRKVNDGKGHKAVVAAMGTAIRRLEKAFKAEQKATKVC